MARRRVPSWLIDVIQWGSVVAIVSLAVVYCVLESSGKKRPDWIRVGIASLAMAFLCVSFFAFAKSYRERRRIYLVTIHGGELKPPIDLTGYEKFTFWNLDSDDKPAEEICSICLAGASEEDCGRTKCCHSFLHKECAKNYWKSINEVVCPNCRHQETPLVAQLV